MPAVLRVCLPFFELSAVYGEDVVIAWGLTYIFPGSFIANLFFSLISWGWALFVPSLAITGLNFSNKWLVNGNETIMLFNLLYQPIIIVVSYFVINWDAGIPVKLLVIGISPLLITLGLVGLLIRRINPI